MIESTLLKDFSTEILLTLRNRVWNGFSPKISSCATWEQEFYWSLQEDFALHFLKKVIRKEWKSSNKKSNSPGIIWNFRIAPFSSNE